MATGLDPRYIPLYQLQQYFVDKATGEPLSAGKVYFYSDVNRTIPKMVFELSSTNGLYSYVPLPNPIILSAWGTPVDNNGNDIVIYAYPLDQFGNSELYYVVVQDADGRPQWTREAVPNSGGGTSPGNNANLFNYVPNGQFLLHTDVPSTTDELVAGTNVIAQGGFTVELSNPLGSINTLEFIPLGFTENPENSPRFLARFTAVTFDPGDTIKNIRIKWNDVNKFSANEDFYTFAFWAEGNVDIPVAIKIVKYFGTTGSIVPDQTIFTDTITTQGDIHQYQFQFGLNEGLIVDTVNNNDFVALDIALPTNFGFQLDITNFVLVNGQQIILNFPLQTNADMVTRGNDGWTNIPQYNGFDLYLPKIQTRVGYEYYEGDIGDIGATIRKIVSPLSSSPLPTTNKMLFDNASYPFDGYSMIGIPFARLGEVLIEESSVANTPMFGTGIDFAMAYIINSDDTMFNLVVNSNGVGVNAAADGLIPTNFGFIRQPTYLGSTVGSNSINYFSFNSGALPNQIVAKGNFFTASQPAQDGSPATGFTISFFNADGPAGVTSIYSYQTSYFTVDTLPAASLIQGPTNPASNFVFSDGSGNNYYMWFSINGEVDPGPVTIGPDTYNLSIEVALDSTNTDADVANAIRNVMNAYQISNIHVTAPPPDGSYFTFQTNPAAIKNYLVYYAYSDATPVPVIPGTINIRVDLLLADTDAEIVTKTLISINKVQYAVPNAPGMYLRNADPNGTWDFDNFLRWSTVTGLVGPNVGTFEYSQFLSHAHAPDNNPGSGTRFLILNAAGASSVATPGAFDFDNPAQTALTGGTETRPVNMYVNYYIKY